MTQKKSLQKKKPDSTQSSTADDADSTLSKLFGGLLKFHEAVAEADDQDLRMYWDIRLIRGADTPFASVCGSSTLQHVLQPPMIASLSAILQVELQEKIGKPLVSIAQRAAEKVADEDDAGGESLAALAAAEYRNPTTKPTRSELAGALPQDAQHQDDDPESDD